MRFLIADSFTDSLARLTAEEQKSVKMTAFDLQTVGADSPGLSFHKLDSARDKHFWSVRASSDIRIIVHRTDDSLLLCYVDHHDKAYEWAGRRKLETHPTTGAAQLVEIRETIREIVVPVYKNEELPTAGKRKLFANIDDQILLGYGVPPEWLVDVREADEDSLFAIAGKLPVEAAEALLELATGGMPEVVPVAGICANPFEHPDAKRRFRLLASSEELERALEYPWEKWSIFLHPAQQKLVEKKHDGPVRVSGSAGTGKTIVALHRTVHLARTNPEARVLLVTFSVTLANSLKTMLRRLIDHEPRLGERIDVYSLDELGQRLFKMHGGVGLSLVDAEHIENLISNAAKEVAGHRFGDNFLQSEWEQVVDAWQIHSWEGYRDVARLGRRTRLTEAQRAILWSIFEKVRADLKASNLMTLAGMYTGLADIMKELKNTPYDFAVIDEAQDIGIPELRFFVAMGRDRPDALFFTGDIGQRIFQQPFSWKMLGVDLRGRSYTLRINYRTSRQIRQQADRLLDPEIRDADGIVDIRKGAISVFGGPPPVIRGCADIAEERKVIVEWLARLRDEGVRPQEIGIFVRSRDEIERATTVAETAGLSAVCLDDVTAGADNAVTLATMHLAKGLEFRAVIVMACDDDVLPFAQRIKNVGDIGDLKEIYDSERTLLYVACTRAREYLIVTGVKPLSEFVGDMGGEIQK